MRLVGFGRAIVKDYYYEVPTIPDGEKDGEGGSEILLNGLDGNGDNEEVDKDDL